MGTLFEATVGGAFALAMIGDGGFGFIVTAVAAAGAARVLDGDEGASLAVEVTIATVRARRRNMAWLLVTSRSSKILCKQLCQFDCHVVLAPVLRIEIKSKDAAGPTDISLKFFVAVEEADFLIAHIWLT